MRKRIGSFAGLLLGLVTVFAPRELRAQQDPPPCYACQWESEGGTTRCIATAIRGKTEGCFFTQISPGLWKCSPVGADCYVWSLLPTELSPDGTVLALEAADASATSEGAVPVSEESTRWTRGCGGAITRRVYSAQAGARLRDQSSRLRI